MGGAYWIKYATFSSGDYDKLILTPSFMSDLEMRTWKPESTNKWIISWIIERIKIRISMVNTAMNNGFFSAVSLSVGIMFGKEGLVILTNLSWLMTEKLREPISHIRCWINGNIAITVKMFYSHMIRRYQLLSLLWYQDPEPDSGLVSGISLTQYNCAPE